MTKQQDQEITDFLEKIFGEKFQGQFTGKIHGNKLIEGISVREIMQLYAEEYHQKSLTCNCRFKWSKKVTINQCKSCGKIIDEKK